MVSLPSTNTWKPGPAWERAHGLNPANPADAALSPTAGGYTNIETYINGLADGKW